MDKKHQDIVSRYIYAKDKNQAGLMASTFSQSAKLDMVVASDAITFPAETQGLPAITEVLLTNFHRSYEKIVTYCISDSAEFSANVLSCNWLVVMTDRASADVKVGCGRYDWQFEPNVTGLADHLVINIEQMEILSPTHSKSIYSGLGSLAYPWCTLRKIVAPLAELKPLDSIYAHVKNWLKKSPNRSQ